MGLWSKGINRSRNDEQRLEDVNTDLVGEYFDGQKYIRINNLFRPYNKEYTSLDLSRPQVIKWPVYKSQGRYGGSSQVGLAFVITDSARKSYIHYNNYTNRFMVADYSRNIISEKMNVKSTFLQTLNRMSEKNVFNLTPESLKHLKKTLKPINRIINGEYEHRKNMMNEINEWLKN